MLLQMLLQTRVSIPGRLLSRRRALGFSLPEVMVAVAIFAISLLGFMMGLMTLRYQNRLMSQRELGVAQARELLELIKGNAAVNGYDTIRYGKSTDRVYLKAEYQSNPPEDEDLWQMPTGPNAWVNLYPVDDIDTNADSFSEKKLPDAQWAIEILPNNPPDYEVVNAGPPEWRYREVVVRVRWRISAARAPWHQVELRTFVSPQMPGM